MASILICIKQIRKWLLPTVGAVAFIFWKILTVRNKHLSDEVADLTTKTITHQIKEQAYEVRVRPVPLDKSSILDRM